MVPVPMQSSPLLFRIHLLILPSAPTENRVSAESTFSGAEPRSCCTHLSCHTGPRCLLVDSLYTQTHNYNLFQKRLATGLRNVWQVHVYHPDTPAPFLTTPTNRPETSCFILKIKRCACCMLVMIICKKIKIMHVTGLVLETEIHRTGIIGMM